MAKLPRLKSLLKEDFPEVEWIDKLIGPTNSFFNTIYQALNRGLTFSENFQSVVKTLEFKNTSNAFPIEFSWDRKALPTALMVVRVVGSEPTSFPGAIWSYDGSIISISKMYGLVSDADYKITVIAFAA